MRRRPPRRIRLSCSDRRELEAIVRDGRIEQRIARRARVLLAMEHEGTQVDVLAEHVQMTRNAIWYLCRRYEQRGLGALDDAPRSGRPRSISPLGPSPDRTAGLLRSRRHRPADDPLVQSFARRGGSPGHRSHDLAFDRLANPAHC